MPDTLLVNCSNCGHAIHLSEAFTAQMRTSLEAGLHEQHEQQLRLAEARARQETEQTLGRELAAARIALEANTQRARAAEERELEQKRRALELEEAQHTAAERLRLELEENFRHEAEARAQAVAEQVGARVREESALELKLAKEQLDRQREKLQAAQAAELELRRQSEELESRARNIELELARKLDEKRGEWEAQLRHLLADEQALKLREKEKQIDDLRRIIDDLKRKSQQGSQELQGEVLELDIQAALEARFPLDVIQPVPRGKSGADLIQEVRDAMLKPCGRIIWEVKNTKTWQPTWLAKLKDDQRSSGANLSVLVSVALPEEARTGFARIGEVWVVSVAAWSALAVALREQLIQVAFARSAATNTHDKMEALYHYLAGDDFRHKVAAIVDAFTSMRQQLERERRAMERIWKEREKQLGRIITSTAGMYGELRGTIGQAMQPIAALELDDDLLPDFEAASLPNRNLV